MVGNGFGSVSVQKLPNTWTMSNCMGKGNENLDQDDYESTEESPSVRPRFMDFKIYADADHHAAGLVPNLVASESSRNCNSRRMGTFSDSHSKRFSWSALQQTENLLQRELLSLELVLLDLMLFPLLKDMLLSRGLP